MMKLTSIDQLTDEIVGKKGTPDRDEFEYELRMDILGTIIKEARKKRKLTQEQLGELLGVKKSQISKLENNTKDYRIGTVLKALKALGAKVKLSVELDSKEEMIVA